MDTFLSPYLVALVIGLVGAGLMVLAARANRLLAPRRSENELMPAPRSVEPNGGGRRLPAHGPHYVAALVYAVVVAGAAFLFPWAAVFAAPGFGIPAVVAMAVFGALVAAGAVYAVKRGVGTWL